MRGPAMRRMMVASCEVDNIATRRLTRGYARPTAEFFDQHNRDNLRDPLAIRLCRKSQL
jgi:hypothetical protein